MAKTHTPTINEIENKLHTMGFQKVEAERELDEKIISSIPKTQRVSRVQYATSFPSRVAVKEPSTPYRKKKKKS